MRPTPEEAMEGFIDQAAEIERLKAELARVKEECEAKAARCDALVRRHGTARIRMRETLGKIAHLSEAELQDEDVYMRERERECIGTETRP